MKALGQEVFQRKGWYYYFFCVFEKIFGGTKWQNQIAIPSGAFIIERKQKQITVAMELCGRK